MNQHRQISIDVKKSSEENKKKWLDEADKLERDIRLGNAASHAIGIVMFVIVVAAVLYLLN